MKKSLIKKPKYATKAPFPWFGGKSQAAPVVWEALGDVEHYVEPFAGSLAVLLGRPHLANRADKSETVNDIDGLLVNAWRSIQFKPDETAEAASWPVSEVDVMARQYALVKWRETKECAKLRADPTRCNPVMAGWWLYGLSAWIGSGWTSVGPWAPDKDGAMCRIPKQKGVSMKKPHLSDDGQGAQNQTFREPGLGVPHPTTMPKLKAWFGFLSARLRHVRVVCGDWKRVLTPSSTKTLSVRNAGFCGIFLDPPYASDDRAMGLYYVDDREIAGHVRKWAIDHGEDPKYRIVLAGFEGEHRMPKGWRQVEWFKKSFLTGGIIGNQQYKERLWLSPHCLRQKRQVQTRLFTNT